MASWWFGLRGFHLLHCLEYDECFLFLYAFGVGKLAWYLWMRMNYTRFFLFVHCLGKTAQ